MKTFQFLRQYWKKRGKSADEARRLSTSVDTQPAHLITKLHKSQPIRKVHPPLMWGLAVISLTSVIGYRFYNQPQLSVGTESPVTIIAPKNGTFEDRKTTEEKRKEVRTGIVPVLQRDLRLTAQLKLELAEVIAEIKQLRQETAPFPFISIETIPLAIQQDLRTATDKDWQGIVKTLTTEEAPNPTSEALEPAIEQLNDYRQATSPEALKELLNTIKQSRQDYAQVRSEFFSITTSHLTPDLMAEFLSLDEATWQKTETTLTSTLQKVLTQGIPPGMPDYLLTEIINVQLGANVSQPVRPMATQLLMRILQNQHNLTVDKEETKRRAEQAAQAIEPVIVEIKAGDVIVEAGEKITQEEFVLLDSFELSRRGINWLGLGIAAVLVATSVTVFCVVSHRIHRPMRRRDHLLLCLLSLSTPLLAIFNLGYTNLPAVGLLTSSFYGPTLAVTQVLLLSGLSTFAATTINWSYVLAGTRGRTPCSFHRRKITLTRRISAFRRGNWYRPRQSLLFGISHCRPRRRNDLVCGIARGNYLRVVGNGLECHGVGNFSLLGTDF